MRYYVTIYIDELFEKELYKNADFKLITERKFKEFIGQFDLTHAFLGLTKGKSPDELDEMDKKINDNKLKNADWQDIDKKWYHTREISEFNDGFWGFGTGTTSIVDTAGKVFENNHYVVDNDTKTNTYNVKKLRSTNTFSKTNRCVLEISKEQYNTLLENIKKDFESTKQVKPNTKSYVHYDLRYSVTNNNCVNWVQKQLRKIGINVFENFTIPGNFMDMFDSIKNVHSIFLTFQSIDSNLQTILGAKSFIKWVTNLVGNKYMKCAINNKSIKTKPNISLNCTMEEQEQIYAYWKRRNETIKIYERLAEYLQSLIDKAEKSSNFLAFRGEFIFIYVSHNQGYMLHPNSNYEAQTTNTLDLNISAYNFGASELYPFIFLPNNETLFNVLYSKYDYPNISQDYITHTMTFYFDFLEGKEITQYWSELFHTINNRIKYEYKFA
ncbi:hypothetical protein [Helicobacter sp. T3_23-1059]